MKKIKILFVIWALNTGGAEKSLINLLLNIDKERYEIELLLFQKDSILLDKVPCNINIVETPKEVQFLNNRSIKKMIKNFNLKGLIYRLRYLLLYKNKAISSYNKDQILWQYVWSKCVLPINRTYDVAVAYMHSIPSYYVIDKVEAKNKILWVHHDYSKLNSDISFDFEYFKKANAVVTVSNTCRDILCKEFPKLKDKFRVLSNINSATSIKKLSSAFMPIEYLEAIQKEIPILISIGRLHEVKGFDLAVEAASILKEKGIFFKWYIIGDGELKQNLLEKITLNKLDKYVYLLGRRENPYPYIKYASIVIQTSRNEGKSIVLDEAKILCKPIISTNYESVKDQIKVGVTGILTNIAALDISKSIELLIKNKYLQDKLVFNLKNSSFDTTNEIDKYYELFK